MPRRQTRIRPLSGGRGLAGVLSAVLISGVLAAVGSAPAARADTAPPAAGTPATVSADALPTVQINGVVWAQVTVGTTVYATGSFTQARPAGAAAGTNQTGRANLLAYNITTGALITTFNHSLNGQGLAIAASPNGSRVYVGGEFTTVDGQARNRIAAFDTATGALVAGFAPNLNAVVRTVTATNDSVFAGGSFSTAGGLPRSRLASFTAATGAVTTWAPVANDSVTAMVMAPDNSRVVVGGRFTTLNGAALIGIGAVASGGTGANTTWNAGFPILDSGSGATYTALVADGTRVYGTAYQFGAGGNFEGRFAVNPYTGNIVWLNSCHGDSYGAAVIGSVLYSAGHAHDCSDAEDFSQDDNNVFNSTHHFVLAESTEPTGAERQVVFAGGPGIPGPRYSNFAGQTHSAELNWYPTLREGTYTGQSQAAWSVSGNADYLSVGGEFPTANGVAQQGLVRFAVRAHAPNTVGPVTSAQLTPVAVSRSATSARVAWRTTSDPDNVTLTYRLYRDAGTTPILTTTTDSRFWYQPALRFTDTGLAAGSSHTYRVSATDPLGNVRTGGTSAAVTIGGSLTAYQSQVLSDGASNFWPLSETSGTAGYDLSGGNDLVLGSGVTRNVTGPNSPGPARASSFDGTANAVSASRANGERLISFSVEAWVRTTSTTGGEILGYGLSGSQNSVNTDRTLYLAPNGRPYFGVWQNNTNNTVNGDVAINNGAWHHLVGTVIPGGGMSLYVDGSLAASRPSIAATSVLAGYWRVGGDSLNGWPNAPTGLFALNGSIADVAVYRTPLTFAQIGQHFGGAVANQSPTAIISATGVNLNLEFTGSPSSDPDGTITGYAWTFGDGATATGQSVTHTYATAGTYTVTLTVTDNGGATNTTSTVVTPGQVTYAQDSFQRTVSGGWASADGGGPWTRTGTATNFAVTPGSGTILLAAGANPGSVYLAGQSVRDVELATRFSVDKLATGNGTTFYSVSRRISSTVQYRGRVRITGTGAVLVGFSKFDGGAEVSIGETTVSGLTYAPGTPLKLRFQTTGASPTTLRIKVWPAAATEPAAWSLASTDSSAALQAAGPFGFTGYLSSGATNGPATVSVSDFRATTTP